MKCCYCNKEIDEYNEPYTTFGIDFDFIHVDCTPKAQREAEIIANMTDKEFWHWISF